MTKTLSILTFAVTAFILSKSVFAGSITNDPIYKQTIEFLSEKHPGFSFSKANRQKLATEIATNYDPVQALADLKTSVLKKKSEIQVLKEQTDQTYSKEVYKDASKFLNAQFKNDGKTDGMTSLGRHVIATTLAQKDNSKAALHAFESSFINSEKNYLNSNKVQFAIQSSGQTNPIEYSKRFKTSFDELAPHLGNKAAFNVAYQLSAAPYQDGELSTLIKTYIQNKNTLNATQFFTFAENAYKTAQERLPAHPPTDRFNEVLSAALSQDSSPAQTINQIADLDNYINSNFPGNFTSSQALSVAHIAATQEDSESYIENYAEAYQAALTQLKEGQELKSKSLNQNQMFRAADLIAKVVASSEGRVKASDASSAFLDLHNCISVTTEGPQPLELSEDFDRAVFQAINMAKTPQIAEKLASNFRTSYYSAIAEKYKPTDAFDEAMSVVNQIRQNEKIAKKNRQTASNVERFAQDLTTHPVHFNPTSPDEVFTVKAFMMKLKNRAIALKNLLRMKTTTRKATTNVQTSGHQSI